MDCTLCEEPTSTLNMERKGCIITLKQFIEF